MGTRFVAGLVLAAVIPGLAGAQPETVDQAALVRAAAADGRLAWMLTEPEEVEALLGAPQSQTTKNNGDMEVLFVEYAAIQAAFGRMRDHGAPFTLRRVAVRGLKRQVVDIGEGGKVVLRHEGDLLKFDSFWGFANASLAELDLRKHAELLRSMPFDSRTDWPPAARLPDGFDPARVLEDGKNPGLGVRSLHAQGIDGRRVRVGIIDQPLEPDHQEYTDRVERYQEVGVSGVEPQMHGPPVTSIVVGKTCGVAPAARVSYFAVPMWKPDNKPYCDIIEQIMADNDKLPIAERIRVVSISTAMFPRQANFDRWKEVLKRAGESGLLVITCSQDAFQYGRSARKPGLDPDDPHSYPSGSYGVRPGAVLVPAGNRTTASYQGPDVYTYWTEAGLSWATPYLAGLAALAYQVDPSLKPEAILDLLGKTAVRTEAGLVVNPVGFVDAVRSHTRGK